MFDIGWSEILVIAVVTIIVVGPKDLPRLLRTFGQIARKVRQTANEFRGHVDDVIRDAELEDLKSTMDDVKSMNPVNQVKKAITDEVDGVRDIVSETDIRNYHEDFPDEEPYDDFDDPGAEWSDEEDALFEDPKPEPASAPKTKTENDNTANARGNPDVKRTEPSAAESASGKTKATKNVETKKTASKKTPPKKSGAKKAPSRAARG